MMRCSEFEMIFEKVQKRFLEFESTRRRRVVSVLCVCVYRADWMAA
jgi:hypothetical protein